MLLYSSKNLCKNRQEFIFFLQVINANPNGNPDMGNAVRFDDETMHGYITDVSLKSGIRNQVRLAHGHKPGMSMIIENETNLDRKIAQIKESAGVAITDATKAAVLASRIKACDTFYDVRTFGAVLSVGPNAGQIRGPVQLSFGWSLSPINPQDICITRCQQSDDLKNGVEKTVDNYVEDENSKNVDQLRTMGRKTFIPFGLYMVHVYVSANLAEETGFSEEDLEILQDAIMNMYEGYHSATKTDISVVGPMIIFKHVGTSFSNQEDKAREAKLGCAPAHKLFELVSVKEKDGIIVPRSYRDYDASVDISGLAKYPGVEIGFKPYAGMPISWGKLPDSEDWFTSV